MHYTDPNYNPLLDPVEEDYRKRVDQFTRDLAWGVLKGYWSPRFDTKYLDGVVDDGVDSSGVPRQKIVGTPRHFYCYQPLFENSTTSEIRKQFDVKWNYGYIPTVDDLQFWGFVSNDNVLTRDAIELLDKPSIAPKVFISYRHIASSTFALAIEARLKYAGNNNIFIDKELNPGERFDTQITDAIENCDYFVLLVDKDLFATGSGGVSWVKKEYELAVTLDKTIIPIIHPNVEKNDFKALAADGFDTTIQYIDCKGIAAFDYETAINRLLNAMGYATY